jgi:murein DD-endopeptidase MepM/ murein hydrolase activator NlpD
MSPRPVLVAFGCLFALPVLIGFGARWSAYSDIAVLERSNAALRVENASYRGATGELAEEISSLQAAVSALSAQAAVDPAVSRAMEKLPAIVKSRAMGGGSARSVAGPAFSTAFGAPDNTLGVLRELLGVLESRLSLVRSGVQRRQALASATPSMWPVAGWLSSPFGARRDPFTGGADFHPGLDISADYGEPVHATADGVVASAAFSGNYGNLIVVEHGYGITTRYGHLSKFGTRTGQKVHRGDVLGYVGSTGRSTASHLHYEILVNGQLTNPLKLLSAR